MKHLFFTICLIISIPTYATTMCAANDTVAIILDPSIQIASVGTLEMERWWAHSSYGTLYGIGACLNSTHGKARGGSLANLTDTNNNGETNYVTGSERYGRYCWCRLIHPVSSLWVYGGASYGSASSCASDCVAYCGRGFRDNADYRTGLIDSIETK